MRNKFRFLNVLFSVCLLLCFALLAKALDQYQIKSWTTDEGLPQNTVRNILQTPDGYLWLTTLDGLARFDGVRFTVFNKQNTPNLATNRLNQLVQTADGDLWIGAETDYVIRYHDGVFTSFDLGGEKRNTRIINLPIDDQGVPVVFTGNGIFRWNGESFLTHSIDGVNNQSNILWSRSGAFWYSEGSLLHRLKDGAISDFQLPQLDPYITIVRLFEDSRGRIWIGSHNGLFVVENDQLKTFTTADGLPNDDTKPFIEDRDGNIWIVTIEGIVTIAPDWKINIINTAQGLSDNFGASVFQDREGSIWVGTFRRGLNRLTRRSINFYSTKDGLADPGVNPIYQLANGDIMLGGSGVTLFHADRFSPFQLPPPNNAEAVPRLATSIAQDRTGKIWVGYWDGVYTYKDGKFTDYTKIFAGLKPNVYDIHESGDGAIWFATNAGIYRYQNDSVTHFTKAQNNLAGDDAKVIHESAGGTFWFGTYGGLSEYKDGFFTNYTTADGLASNQVRSLYEDADKVLWIGSYDGGLTRFKNGKFTRYTTADGLFNDGVFQILEDDAGNFWMSSNRGIYRVAKQQLDDFADGKIRRIESIAYDKSDGLLETECNGGQQPAGAKMRDGKLWFPTQGGVAVIEPETIRKNPIPPPVIIETAKIDGADVTFRNEIEVAPGKNNLEINYTGLSFIKPEFVKFRYRLKNLDAGWIEAGNRRTAYYSYLPPGDYDFTVIAANADGVWNETGASVRVSVIPPFYRRWWFIALLSLTIGGLLIFFYNWRQSKIKRQKAQQENFSRRLMESQEQERSRIAAEMHDGLSQTLVVIKNRADLSLTMPDNAERAFEQLEEISAAASDAVFEAKEIVYNLRPIQLERFGLTKSIRVMLKRLGDIQNIEFKTDLDSIDNLLPPDAEKSFYRILQESVNNIVRHSQADSAEIRIKHENNAITATISDDGRGFDSASRIEQENPTGGFGLLGINERARLLDGIVRIHSVIGKGTVVRVIIPVKNTNV